MWSGYGVGFRSELLVHQGLLPLQLSIVVFLGCFPLVLTGRSQRECTNLETWVYVSPLKFFK